MKPRKSHRRNAVKCVILKSERKKQKTTPCAFRSQFQVQKGEQKKEKTKLRVLTSGGGGRTWINIPLLSECVFVSTQSRLGFGITYCAACVPPEGNKLCG